MFTLSIRGPGRHAKRGRFWIVTSVSGEALFPLRRAVGGQERLSLGMAVQLWGFCLRRRELDGFRVTKFGYVDGDGVTYDPDRELMKVSLKHERRA
jgi:hypothetical protein